MSSCNDGNLTPRHPQPSTPLLSLPPRLRIAHAAAVLDGPHGAVTQRACQQGLSRRALYRGPRRILQALDGPHTAHQLHGLHEQSAELRRCPRELQAVLDSAVFLDPDCLAAFARSAQAEGVSLPVARRLLVPLLAKASAGGSAPPKRPRVAQLGRWSRAAAGRAAALLEVLDALSRPRVQQAAPDASFFGKQPCLMVVERHSLCWVRGRLAERRDGAEWAQGFRQLPNLRPATQDGGTGLARGLALGNAERRQAGQSAVCVQDDPFPVLREGTRALRKPHGKVSRLMEQAAQADRRAPAKERRTGDGRGRGAVAKARRRAERALDAWSAAEQAGGEVGAALRRFTPQGALDTRAQAEAALQAAFPRLSGPPGSEVRRLLQRPPLLTSLDKAQEGLSSVPVPGELRAAAVRGEGLRRQPEPLRDAAKSAAALRGVLLAAGLVRSLWGAAGSQALAFVRGTRRGVWRASSLVECSDSVARVQQGRPRKMTQGLLDLKRLYWNGRAFRTGHRRRKSPDELQGLALPTRDWWELLRRTPEQWRRRLQPAKNATGESPPQKVSGQDVAA